MAGEKLTICVHKLLCAADQSDLLHELRKATQQKRKSRCKPTYSRVVPSRISWCQLQALIDTKVSLGGFDADIEYIDDEGDCVAIGGDDELREAIKVGLKSENKELRLLLYHYKRKSKSAQMLRRNSQDRMENGHKPLVRLQPAKKIGTLFCDESGEKSPPVGVDVAPKWFVNYMDKFKTDLTQDISDRVTRKTVKKLAHSMPDLTDARNKEKGKDSAKKGATCHDAICDVCDKPILGVRFKCGNCDDFDLCDKCESEEIAHDPDHVFLKIRRPAQFAGKRKGRTAPLLKKSIYYVDPMKEIRRIAKMPIVEPMEICEKYGRRRHHEKLTEKLKRRHEIQRDAPYKREKLVLSSWLKAQESAETLVLGARCREPFGCCFVRDESIPDETHLQPGTKFTKKWVMRNTGLNAWDENVEFVMQWGSLPCVEPRSGAMPVPHLAPDQEATIGVDMLAPAAPGNYQNTWSLQYNGRCFGHRVWCKIIVDVRELLEARSSLEIVDKADYEVVGGDTETNEESGEVCIVPRKEDDDDDEPISYQIVKNEEELLKVPVSKASQTATPNNTPLVSSPPKSPAPELELAARRLVVSTSLEAVAERCEKECQEAALVQEKMARLALSEVNLDIESYSEDSDSESDYFVVPLPQCFDVNTPMTRSTADSNLLVDPIEDSDDCCSEKSFDLVSHVSQDHQDSKETALKLGYDLADEQPEIELQDLSSEKRSDDNDNDNDEAFELASEPEDGPTLPEREVGSSEDIPKRDVGSSEDIPERDVGWSEEPRSSERGEQSFSATSAGVVVKNQDSGEEVRCVEHGERVLRAPVPPEMHVVQETTEELADLDQTMVKRPMQAALVESDLSPSHEQATVAEIRSCENGEVIHQEEKTQYEASRSSPGLEDFVNAAFEAAGSAASSAIHAAKDVVSMLKQRNQYVPPQSTWMPPNQQYMHNRTQWTPSADQPQHDQNDDDAYSDVSDDDNVYPVPRDLTAMETLFDMGFANREVNQRLLALYDNDINKVVTEILSSEGHWPEERH